MSGAVDYCASTAFAVHVSTMAIDPQQQQLRDSLKAGIQCCVDKATALDVEQEEMRKTIHMLQEQLTTAMSLTLSGEKCGWPKQTQMSKGDSFDNDWMKFGASQAFGAFSTEVTPPKAAQSPIVSGPRTLATFGSPCGSFASPSGVPPSPGWLLDSPGEFVPPPPGLGLLENMENAHGIMSEYVAPPSPISLSMAMGLCAGDDDDAGRDGRFQSPKPHKPRRQPLGTPSGQDNFWASPKRSSGHSGSPFDSPKRSLGAPASPFLTPKRSPMAVRCKITPSMRSPAHSGMAMESPFAICESGGSVFSFTTRVASDSFLGLNFDSGEATDNGNYLKVTFVDPHGAMQAWNKQCLHGPAAGKAVMPGDTIVRVNNATTPAEMLEECREKLLLRFTVQRDQVADDFDLMSASILPPAEAVPSPVMVS